MKRETIAEIISEHFKKLGAKGGSVKSEKKTLAARQNAQKGKTMKDYSQAIELAKKEGVDFDQDFHVQNVGPYMHWLAATYGYRKPRNANGSTGRYFFQLLKRRASKS